MKNIFFLLLGAILIVGSIFAYLKQEAEEMAARGVGIETVTLGSTRVEVEVAGTPETRSQGLSGRETLPEGSGMLFIFETPGKYGFWMKDMNFAIDIIWIGEDMRVVGVERQATPASYPNIFYPISAIKYALEVPAGFSDAHSIDTGVIVSFD